MLFGGAGGEWTPDRASGTAAATASAVLAAAAFITIRRIGQSETSLVLSMWFHSAGLASSAAPLAVGWPSGKAVLTGPVDSACLLVISLTSFSGQFMLSRGLQTQPAALASAINFLQVRGFSARCGVRFCSGWGGRRLTHDCATHPFVVQRAVQALVWRAAGLRPQFASFLTVKGLCGCSAGGGGGQRGSLARSSAQVRDGLGQSPTGIRIRVSLLFLCSYLLQAF
eukprot:366494-Chlamydomonas_euryale.AAC.7